MKTNDFLDSIKARYGLPSDYALAAKLGISRAMVSGYRHGKSKLGEDVALTVADLLQLDPGYVLACMEAERTHSAAARAAWENLADRLKRSGPAARAYLAAARPAIIDAARTCIFCGAPGRPGGALRSTYAPTI